MMVPQATIPTTGGAPWPLSAELLVDALPRLASLGTLPRLWWVPLLLGALLGLVLRGAMAANAPRRARPLPPSADSAAATSDEIRPAA